MIQSIIILQINKMSITMVNKPWKYLLKVNLITVLVFLSVFQAVGQDRLFFLDGAEKNVKITEVTSELVKYKQLNDLEGPTLITLITSLLKIVYSNGTEQLIDHTAAPIDAIPPDDSFLNQNSEDALSLGPDVDNWGRTETENRTFSKRRLNQGIIVTSVGAITTATGATLWALSVQKGDRITTPNEYFDHMGSNPDLGVGLLLTAAGSAMLITGTGLFRASFRYKKRASQIANGTTSVSTVILNDTHFSGATVESNSGFGVKLTYCF